MEQRTGSQALPRSSMTQGRSNSRPSPRHPNYASRGYESYKGGERSEPGEGASPRFLALRLAEMPPHPEFLAALGIPTSQPKSDLSDFGPPIVPKSGKPDFGARGER